MKNECVIMYNREDGKRELVLGLSRRRSLGGQTGTHTMLKFKVKYIGGL